MFEEEEKVNELYIIVNVALVIGSHKCISAT